ncbi:MAG: lamin tail domain-containing protein [Verrucomicrobia bacterium]|nr:lamin tail domain-containing protein [Verrucomicrobiota bacterium]
MAPSATTAPPSTAQQFLRITELMFHPAALEGNPLPPDEFEYLELANLSPSTPLDLTGVRFTEGVEFQFTGSSITGLAPGAHVLVVKNPVAFAARYGNDRPVAGAFTGSLDNAGERLRLVDASNEEILDFRYDDDWYPLADGLGFSLVVVDETAAPELWNQRGQWRPSSALSGSPGTPDPPPPPLPPVLVNEALTRPDQPPRRDVVELYNPTDEPADVSGWWLSDALKTPAKFRLPPGSILPRWRVPHVRRIPIQRRSHPRSASAPVATRSGSSAPTPTASSPATFTAIALGRRTQGSPSDATSPATTRNTSSPRPQPRWEGKTPAPHRPRRDQRDHVPSTDARQRRRGRRIPRTVQSLPAIGPAVRSRLPHQHVARARRRGL